MEFTDYMVLKLVVVVVAACIYGFWMGITGR
jgi:hypothetical protein